MFFYSITRHPAETKKLEEEFSISFNKQVFLKILSLCSTFVFTVQPTREKLKHRKIMMDY